MKRGPDKQPRKRTQTNQGRKKLAPSMKAKNRTVSLNDPDKEFLEEKHGTLTKAIKTLLP